MRETLAFGDDFGTQTSVFAEQPPVSGDFSIFSYTTLRFSLKSILGES